MTLDILAAALSGGGATHEIASDPLHETQLSQVFIAVNPASLGEGDVESIADRVVEDLHRPISRWQPTATTRANGRSRPRRLNLQHGIRSIPKSGRTCRRCRQLGDRGARALARHRGSSALALTDPSRRRSALRPRRSYRSYAPAR